MSTPRLMWIYENCIIDEKFLGVLIINNSNEFVSMMMQKVNDYTEKYQKQKLVHITIEYNCSRRFVISNAIKLGKTQGRIQDLIRGGPQIVTSLNCRQCAAASCEQSEPYSAWDLGPALGPQKLLGISLLNMHSLHFGVPFYTIFEIIKY